MSSDEWAATFMRGITRVPRSRAYRNHARRAEPTWTHAQQRLLEFLKHRIKEGEVTEYPEGEA